LRRHDGFADFKLLTASAFSLLMYYTAGGFVRHFFFQGSSTHFKQKLLGMHVLIGIETGVRYFMDAYCHVNGCSLLRPHVAFVTGRSKKCII